MGLFNQLIARHRASLTEHLLRFSSISDDHLLSSTFDGKVVDASIADVIIEMEVNLLRARTDITTYLWNAVAGFQWVMLTSGNLRVYRGASLGYFTISGFRETYRNEGKIKLKLTGNSLGDNKFFVNDVEIYSELGSFVVNSTMSAFFRLNSAGSQSNDIDVYNFNMNGEIFNFNEGSGFNTTSNLGGTFQGMTDNAGGLVYWDNNVWIDPTVVQYKLSLNNISIDHLVVSTGDTGWFDTSLLVGLPSYYFEIDVNLRDLPTTNDRGLIGNYNTNTNSDRLAITVSSFSGGRMTIFHGGSNVFLNGILPAIIGVRTVVRMEFTMLDANTYEGRLYFNGVLQDTSNYAAFTGGNTNMYAWVGARGGNQTSPTANSGINADVYSADYNGDFLPLDEGSGFSVYSKGDVILEGKTTNSGGLAYWDNNVWVDPNEIQYKLSLNSINEDYIESIENNDFDWVTLSDAYVNISFEERSAPSSGSTLFNKALMGQDDELRIQLDGSDITFYLRIGGIVIFLHTYNGVLLNEIYKVEIKGDEGIFVNDVNVFSLLPYVNQDTTALNGSRFRVGRKSYTILDDTVDINLHSFVVGSDYWKCNEGGGFDLISENGVVAIGTTSNSGGLTYWDNNVWRKTDTTKFVSTWETTGALETIQLPVTNLYTVDWGDGTVTTTETSHEYAVAGQYVIRIEDEIDDWAFINTGDKTKLKNISNWGGFEIILNSLFGCSALDITATDIPTISDGENALRGCSTLLYNSSINDWDMSLVTEMNSFFYQDFVFNQPIGNWDLSSCTTAQFMFFQCLEFNQPLNTWDVSNFISLNGLFYSARKFNQSLSSWVFNVSATNFTEFFRDAQVFNQPLPWDMSNVTTMSSMFQGAVAFNQDISSWDFSSVVSLNNFMNNKTDADYDAAHYDALLIKWDNAVGGLVFANMTNVNIGMGTIKYTAAGATARASLISKGFVCTDGGQV